MFKIITEEMLDSYASYLRAEEKSLLTIEKYIRDVRKLMEYADGEELSKELVIQFKEKLYYTDQYKIGSVNSILEVINRFFEYMNWYNLRVKPYRRQAESFLPEERFLSKSEYKRLLQAARTKKNKRLYLIMETLASTGMRVSELYFVTVEAVKSGVAEVYNKGKIRKVLLTKKLQSELRRYVKELGITEGQIFRTRTGQPIHRSNIWKELKQLCELAKVEPTKVYPHSFRRLFARCLYQMKLDIAFVADILGHSNIETTRRYIRQTTREYRKTLERMALIIQY